MRKPFEDYCNEEDLINSDYEIDEELNFIDWEKELSVSNEWNYWLPSLYLRDNCGITPLSHAEEVDLIKRTNWVVTEEFFIQYHRLIHLVIGKYKGIFWISEDDLFQSWFEWLQRALKGFDITKWTKFSTYAVFCIRTKVFDCIWSFSDGIWIPYNVRNKLYKIIKLIEENPWYADISVEKLSIITWIEKSIIKAFFHWIPSTISMSSSLESDSSDWWDNLLETTFWSYDISYKNIEDKDEVWKLLKYLPEKERCIIMMHYWIDDYRVYTLKEIADLYWVTYQRIQLLEKKIIEKLRLRYKDLQHKDAIARAKHNYRKLNK